jgi:Thioesterase domain
MLVCVDGTGASDTAEYARIFARSFVNRVKNEYLRAHPHPDPPPIHHRGPGADVLDGLVGGIGGEHHVDPEFIVQEIVETQRRINDEVDAIPAWALGTPASAWSPEETAQLQLIEQRRKVFLVGHSRGGAIVIHVARIMQRRGMPVEAMFLFDAVARNLSLDAEEIPANVRFCYHAMRDEHTLSRPMFGNCGTYAAGGVMLRNLPRFWTTHGGMGGTPLGSTRLTASGHIIEPPVDILAGVMEGDATNVTPAQEVTGSQEVERWMWPFLREHGVVP